MIIDVAGLLKIGGTILGIVVVLYLAIVGFKGNSQMHNGGKSNGVSSDSGSSANTANKEKTPKE